jgi:hypothetical protein
MYVGDHSHYQKYEESSQYTHHIQYWLPKYFPKVMCKPDPVFVIDAYKFEPLLFPKPNGTQ